MQTSDSKRAHQLAQHALARAHMTNDPRQRHRWQEIADSWLTRAAGLEGQITPTPDKKRVA
jgi:hypothetical protein